MRLGSFDVFLVAVLIASATVISIRLLKPKGFPTLVLSAPVVRAVDPAAPIKPLDFNSIVENSENRNFKSGKAQETRRCKATGGWSPKTYGTVMKSGVDPFLQNRLNFFLGPTNDNCFKVGDEVQLLLVAGWDSTGPMFSVVGKTKIHSIFQVRSADVPSQVLESIGFDRKHYEDHIENASDDTIFFLGHVTKSTPKDFERAVIVFPNVQIVTQVELTEFLRRPGLVTIELRTPPVETKSFDWAITRSELKKVPIPVPEIELAIKKDPSHQSPVLVLCEHDRDLKCLAVLAQLAELDFRSLHVSYARF